MTKTEQLDKKSTRKTTYLSKEQNVHPGPNCYTETNALTTTPE
jgi:hypothetical protein